MSLGRLQRALEIADTWRADPRRPEPALLLAQHPDLRDLLEPLVLDESDPAGKRPALPTTPERVPTELGPGQVLGEYRIVREIGRGGTAVVFEAHQVSLDRRVALKVLPATTNPATVARFKREAGIAARLTHPGIVQVLGVGSHAGLWYIAMELVAGTALPADGSLGIARATELVAEIAEALAFAHSQGVVHRDVKPGNILVREDGRAVLTDFGLARDEELPSLSRTGALVGTPFYMAPERCAAVADGEPIGPLADVFSLGVTLYEVLTGRRPFEGGSAFEVMHAILRREPASPNSFNPDLAPDLVAVVQKAIEKAPADRYPSAAAFAADLRAFLAYRPVSAHQPSGFVRMQRFVRREPAKAALGVLALVALGLVVFVLATSGERAVGAARRHEETLETLLADGYFELRRAAGAESAQRAFERACVHDATSVEARAGLAFAQIEAGAPERALRTLEGAPPAPVLTMVRAMAAAKLGDGAALERLERADSEQDPSYHFFLGMHQLARAQAAGRKPEARAALDTLTRAILRSRKARMPFHFVRGLAALEVGEPGVARESALVLRFHWPESPETDFFVGTLLSQIDAAESIAAFERYLAVRPDAYRARSNYANALYTSGQRERGMQEIERALALAPEDGQLRSRLAFFCYENGDLERAKREALAATERIPQHEPIWLLLTGIHTALGDLKSACVAAERATQVAPMRARTHFTLGNTLLVQGELERALPSLERAAELDPLWVEPWLDQARAHAALDRPGKAVACAREAIARAPQQKERVLGELRQSASSVTRADAGFRRFFVEQRGAASRPQSTATDSRR